MEKVKSTGKVINDVHYVLECTEKPFEGIQFYYEGMKFADEENPDGSIMMKFEYTLVESGREKISVKEFEQYIGDALISILDDQMKSNELVYKGGSVE
jgi:hypothetical protein